MSTSGDSEGTHCGLAPAESDAWVRVDPDIVVCAVAGTVGISRINGSRR